jgi:hypothetical protein
MHNATSRTTLEGFALLATSVLVRSVLPDTSFFGPDQVGVLVDARRVLEGDWFPPGPGIGWTPFSLGPLFEWLTALGLLPRNEFADVILLLALIHGISVLAWQRLFAEVSEKTADAHAVRLTGWALALHPMAISLGCAPVSASIVMPTTLLFVWGNLRWFRSRSTLGFALACVGAALMVQAHITTLFLLPLLLVGFSRKAPIGRIGLAGMALAIVIVSPMAIPNLGRIGTGPFQHAGTTGAPFVVALARAALLEMRWLDIFASLPATWRVPAQVVGLVWVVFMLVGAVVLVRRRDDGSARVLVFFGLVVDTVCVALLPRGALLLYLDATIPFRCWLFAVGVNALTASAARRLRTKAAAMAVGAVALTTVVSLGAFVTANRFATAALGFWRINMAGMDLREPLGPSHDPISVLTLGSLRALGRAFKDLGVSPESLERAWHGPWRWAGAQSAGVWIGQDAKAPERDAQVSFIVLHEADPSIVPRSTRVPASHFRVYTFDNRLRMDSDDGEHLVASLEAGSSGSITVQIVTDSSLRVTRLRLPSGDRTLTPVMSASGFLVWSTSIDAADGSKLGADLAVSGANVLQIRSSADAYAFVPGEGE